MNTSAKRIAFFGVFGALIYVLLLLETQVLGTILPISPCFLSLPLAISLSVYGDYKNMFIGGTVLGVCSLLLSLIFPQFIVFLNPLISVLPRLILGIVAFGVCKLFKWIFKNSKSNFFKSVLPYSLSGMFGAITNTVLVVTMLFIFNFTGIEQAFQTIISFNALIEIISAIILVPVITKAIKIYLHSEK